VGLGVLSERSDYIERLNRGIENLEDQQKSDRSIEGRYDEELGQCSPEGSDVL